MDVAPPDRIAALPLAVAVILSPVAPVLAAATWLALAEGPPPENVARLAALLLAVACGMALVTGVPLALWLLRDPKTPLWRWAAAGLGGGLCAGAAICVWPFTSHARELIGIGDVIGPLAVAATGSVGLVSGLLARAILFRVFRVR